MKKRVLDMGFRVLGRKCEGFEERVMEAGRKVAIVLVALAWGKSKPQSNKN